MKPDLFGGKRPDITPAQIVSAVPILVALLAAFGLWSPTDGQEEAMKAAVAWAAALVLGDAGLRIGRNLASARSAVVAPAEPPGLPDYAEDEATVTDGEPTYEPDHEALAVPDTPLEEP